MLCVLAVVSVANELELLACLCFVKRGLYLSARYDCERLGIEIIVVGLVLGDSVDVLDSKETVVEHESGVLGVLRGEPMDSTLDLSSVNGVAVSRLKISRRVYLNDIAVGILNYLTALDYISAHKSYLALRLEAEELGRRYLSKVRGVYIDLAGKGQGTCAKLRLLRMVGKIKGLLLVCRIVVDDYLDRMLDSDPSGSCLVELLADGMLKHAYINKAVSLGDACRADEIEDRLGGVATSAERADGGKSRVIPAVNHIILNEVTEVSLGHYRVGNVETSELSLLGLGVKDTDVVYYPLVERSVVFKLKRAE